MVNFDQKYLDSNTLSGYIEKQNNLNKTSAICRI